jgi:purine nucleoside permease
MDAILAIQWVLNGSTGGLSLPFRNRRLAKATTLTARVLGIDTLLGELRFGNVMKKHSLVREHLPFIAKHDKVVEFRNTIAVQGLSSPKVAQHSNGIAKRLVTAVLKVDTDKLPESRNNNLLAWVLGAQVNLEPARDLLAGVPGVHPALGIGHAIEVIRDWKATKRRELFLVLKVDPVAVVCFRQDWIRGPFDLENVITDTDGSALDVTPETN